MLVLVVLLVSTLVARAIGFAGVAFVDSWAEAVRVGLAAMLLFTSTAHFNAMKSDLARMVPKGIPAPMTMIYLTGVCEILGAVGLLIPSTRRLAAIALILMFMAVFPANVRAAREGLAIGGRKATPLWLRAPMQIAFIVLTWWAGVR